MEEKLKLIKRLKRSKWKRCWGAYLKPAVVMHFHGPCSITILKWRTHHWKGWGLFFTVWRCTWMDACAENARHVFV